MNGTTNFMLTKMEQEGADYAVVLKEAQDLGFAEADPTADVEGHDVQAKIALLAKVAHIINSHCCLHSLCCHLRTVKVCVLRCMYIVCNDCDRSI
jgi:Homoserine dehydrogenase